MSTSSSIRVADLGELPPGKGKVLELAGRRVTVYNREGRFYGTSTRCHTHAGARGEPSSDCSQRGLRFDVAAEDSPAKLGADEVACEVVVEDSYVYLLLPDDS